MNELNEATFIILMGLMGLSVVLIILLFLNRKYIRIKTIKTTNPQEFENFMKENNFPEEIMQHMKDGAVVTSTKTVRTVKYVNGEKVSDVTETTTNNTQNPTYCPNCGAKLDDNTSNTCRYCNSTFIR